MMPTARGIRRELDMKIKQEEKDKVDTDLNRPYVGKSDTDVDVSPITECQQTQLKLCDMLSGSINELEARLAPVSTPTDPGIKMADLGNTSEPGGGSPVHNSLRTVNDRLEQMRNRVINMTGKLEV